jgi:hypothetical protein
VPSGTSREAQDLFIDRLAEMAPGERAVLANQLSADVVTLALAGIRAANPGMSDRDACRELARRRNGAALADAAFAHDEARAAAKGD